MISIKEMSEDHADKIRIARRKEEKDKSEKLESLAKLEHDQWVEWSKSVAPEVSETRRKRWEKLWIPYSELSEEMKEEDRKWAKKVMKII